MAETYRDRENNETVIATPGFSAQNHRGFFVLPLPIVHFVTKDDFEKRYERIIPENAQPEAPAEEVRQAFADRTKEI